LRAGNSVVALLAYALIGQADAVTADGGPAHHRLTNLQVIGLHLGENRIAHFSNDGRPARIVMAWRGNGNAHGYNIFLVVMPGGETQSDWNVVDTDDPHGKTEDFVTDSPFDGELYLHSIRFARGRLDGKPETLLLSARRDIKDTFADRSAVIYDIYKLVHDDNGFGTHDYFLLVETLRPQERYCSSELAISRQFSIPLPKDFPVNQKDGCP
jgi:hypothetical protein